jgi:hypothetical protein
MSVCGVQAASAKAKAQAPVDLLVIGDSQISFGSGPAFEAFFADFATHCADADITAQQRMAVSDLKVGMVGVRSTGLTTWLARSNRGKRMMCVRDPDPRGLVNASVWGAMQRNQKQRWVQIGDAPGYRYCKQGQSTLRAMLATFPRPPKLIMFHVMATDSFRWTTPKRIEDDLKRLEADLPNKTACIYFTTAPTYRTSVNARRVRAQAKLAAAISKTGSRCRLINGLTPATRKAFEGNAAFFYRHKSGRVRDPYHPTNAAARVYLKRHAKAVCKAVVSAIIGKADQGITRLRGTSADASVARKPGHPLATP